VFISPVSPHRIPPHYKALTIGFNGVDLTGLLGDIKEDWGSGGWKSPSGVRGGAPVRGLGDEFPQKLKLFL